MRKAQVIVCENALGEIAILYKGHPLAFSIFEKQQHQADVVSSKDIDAKLVKSSSPSPDHPWRDYGKRLSGKLIPEAAHHEHT